MMVWEFIYGKLIVVWAELHPHGQGSGNGWLGHGLIGRWDPTGKFMKQCDVHHEVIIIWE